jgi:hypothetical protein
MLFLVAYAMCSHINLVTDATFWCSEMEVTSLSFLVKRDTCD